MGRRWDDGSYYGIKTKRYFKYLDTMVIKLFKEAVKQNTEVNLELLEQILKITARQNSNIHTIGKIVETLEYNQRLINIENLIRAVPAGALAEAVRNNPEWGSKMRESVNEMLR